MLPPLLYTTDPGRYHAYLEEKCAATLQLFADHGLSHPQPQIVASPAEHFRMRAEFGIYFEDQKPRFCMFEPHTKPRVRVPLDSFPMAAEPINAAMAALSAHLGDYRVLCHKLFSCSFLSASSGETVISLQYHTKLDEASFAQAATELEELLEREGLKAHVVGRARKQCVAPSGTAVTETLRAGTRTLALLQHEGHFSQPNHAVCQEMVNFAYACSEGQQERDLLELYCGSGTFTVCLASSFRHCLCTEVARVPAQAALQNIELNHIVNTKLVRLSAAEVRDALSGVRPFRRLLQAEVELDDYDFSTLLVDPPRCGINDEQSRRFLQRFNRVIYVSCNPRTLCADISALADTHVIQALGIFDQFPYTPHVETAVLMSRG